MTDTLELDIAMKRAHVKRKDAAEALGISLTCFFQKIHNVRDFKISEVMKLKNFLNLSDKKVMRIFFANNVDFKATS